MSQIEANEQARRNYAIEAYTRGEEYFLSLTCGGDIIATLCAPEGPTPPNQFILYNLDGLGDDDEENVDLIVKRFNVRSSVNDTWREAVRFAYAHALSKMMIVDQRAEREDDLLVA